MLTLPKKNHKVIYSYELSNVSKTIEGEDVTRYMKNRIRVRFRVKNIANGSYFIPNIKISMSGGWNYGDFSGHVSWLFVPIKDRRSLNVDESKLINIVSAASICNPVNYVNSLLNIDVGIDENLIDYRVDVYHLGEPSESTNRLWVSGNFTLEPCDINQYNLNHYEIEVLEYTNDWIDRSEIPSRMFSTHTVFTPLSLSKMRLNENDPDSSDKLPNINIIKNVANLVDNNGGGGGPTN